jgi:hypothetical protein
LIFSIFLHSLTIINYKRPKCIGRETGYWGEVIFKKEKGTKKAIIDGESSKSL